MNSAKFDHARRKNVTLSKRVINEKIVRLVKRYLKYVFIVQ